MLEPLLFPQGQIFHRKKAIMQSFVDGTERPYAFHGWTAGADGLKNMALWPVAVHEKIVAAALSAPASLIVLRTEVRPGLLEGA